MDKERILEQANRIITETKAKGNESTGFGVISEATEFLRIYGGEKSSFYKTINKIDEKLSMYYISDRVIECLEAFIRFIENDLVDGISIERKAQIDVVSDFLEQANVILDNKKLHPASAIVLIGASLEEFMRNWIEDLGLSIGNKKPSIDSYSSTLRSNELITKQDVKDISSWGGMRNSAAHGEWEEVGDRTRAKLMLEGVNLFIRKYVK